MVSSVPEEQCNNVLGILFLEYLFEAIEKNVFIIYNVQEGNMVPGFCQIGEIIHDTC